MRIVSWNMQGRGSDSMKEAVLTQFFTAGYDVICLQETTSPLGSFTDVPVGVPLPADTRVTRAHVPYSSRSRAAIAPDGGVDAGGAKGAHNYTCYYYRFGAGNNRCSLATYVKNRMLHPFGLVPPPVLPGGETRAMLWVSVPFGAGHIRICNVHLSAQLPTHLNAFQHFHHFRNAIIPMVGQYAIIGDFNIRLDQLPDLIAAAPPPPPPAPPLVAAHFHRTATPTHNNGHTLDYAYYTGAVENIRIVENTLNVSDHRAIEVTI